MYYVNCNSIHSGLEQNLGLKKCPQKLKVQCFSTPSQDDFGAKSEKISWEVFEKLNFYVFDLSHPWHGLILINLTRK